MSNNFVGDQIRRSNRNLLIVNLLLAVCAFCYFIATANFYKAVLTSGQATTPEALAQMSADEHRVVEVNSDAVMESGYQLVEKSSSSKTVKAKFLVMRAGDRILVVKSSPSNPGPHFKGVLSTIPGDLSQKLSEDIKNPSTRARVMPVMLDTIDYRDEFMGGLFFGLPVLLIALWNLKKWMARAADPAVSPIMKQLEHRGGQMATQQIDSEMAQSSVKVGKAIFTQSWAMVPHFFGMHVMHFDDVVWVYKKVTQHRVNFVPTGKTYTAVLCNSMGKTMEVMDKEAKVNELLTAVTKKAPWAIPGFSTEAQQLWTKNRDAMLQAVNARRSAAMRSARQAAAAAGAPVPTTA